MKQIIRNILLCLSLFSTSISCAKSNNNSMHPLAKRATIEQSENIAITAIEYTLCDYGYFATEAVASDGDNEYVGIVYTDFSNSVSDEAGNEYFESGFFQIVPDIDATEHLLNPSILGTEEKPITLFATDSDGSQYVVTKSIASFDSFSFVIDNWYNVVKRVGEMILEVKAFENKREYYDFDISCYSYDDNEWLFKSDTDIDDFNIEAVGLYSDYTKIYTQAVRMMKELLVMQEQSSFSFESCTYVVISGDLLRQAAFGEQKGMINGYYLSDLLSSCSQLQKNQSLSLTPDGIEIVTDLTEEQAQMRLEKGIFGLIANGLLIFGEVCVFVASWGTAGVPMAFAIAATVTASCSLVYATFNIIENVSDIVYGALGDIESRSLTYLKDGFGLIFGEDGADIAYNAWGIANTIASNLIMPIGTIISAGKLIGQTAPQITLSVLKMIGVKTAEAVAIAAGSTIQGFVNGEIAKLISGSNVVSKYVKDFSTLFTAIALGFGVNALEKMYDFSGLTKAKAILSTKGKLTNDEVKRITDAIDKEYTKQNHINREKAAQDILNGANPKDYGLDPDVRPKDQEILDYLFANGKLPRNCHWAHCVDKQRILQAVLDGKISLEDGLYYVGHPKNGMLASISFHFGTLHGGCTKNFTDYNIFLQNRPGSREVVMNILSAIGAV